MNKAEQDSIVQLAEKISILREQIDSRESDARLIDSLEDAFGEGSTVTISIHSANSKMPVRVPISIVRRLLLPGIVKELGALNAKMRALPRLEMRDDG